jgi:glycosyltransferase involved in cell wall biosynthesis
MKILMVTPMPPQRQPTNAVPLVAHALLTGLLARHAVTLLTIVDPDPMDEAALIDWRTAGVEVQPVRRTTPKGLGRWQRRWRLASTWLAGRYPWRTTWFWEPTLQPVLDHLLDERQFDLLLVEDNAVGMYHYRTKTPTIFTEYEVRHPRPLDWRSWSEPNLVRWALREADWQRWQRYQARVWQRFDRLQVFTPHDAATMCAIAPALTDRVRVNPFGIDLPAPADPDREEENTLVFAGGFSHQPNVDAALWLGQEIMPLLRAQCPGVRLVLVGSYPTEAVRALACADVIVTGRVPAIEPFLERAAVILAPIRIGGGMRMKVIQGMALGKAVVTTPRGAEGLLLGEGQPPLIITECAEEFAKAVADLLASKEMRHSLGCRARAFVAEHHSAAAYAGRLEAIYWELQSENVVHSQGVKNAQA